jgi:ABC-type transport system involved in cytochrome c biogenesis permease subunit
MRAIGWSSPGLLLAALLALAPAAPARAAAAAEAAPPKADPRGYEVLGDLAVMDQGRVKPLHTLAIARVKSIYSRSTVKLRDEKGDVREAWGPVAAVLDWSVRPDYWNAQEIVLVEYLPLKRKILASAVKTQLESALARPNLPAADRDALQAAAKLAEPAEADVSPLALLPGLPAEDKAAFKRLAHKLSADNKWLSADDLNASSVVDGDHEHSFVEWFREIVGKQEEPGGMGGGAAKLPPLEEKAAEVGMRLFHYEAIRDRNEKQIPRMDLSVLPRPNSEAYLKFLGAAALKDDGFTPLEQDARGILGEFLENLQREDRAIPGQPLEPQEGEGPEQFKLRKETQQRLEKNLAQWLHEKADWVPLRIVLDADAAELGRAGFPVDKVQAFRTAYEALEAAEQEAPNRLPVDKAQAVVAAGRDLGTAAGKYPTLAAMQRESHFNRFAPFYKAPMAFGLAVLALVLALGVSTQGQGQARGLGRFLYGLGLAGFVGGIALELYGFYLRVAVSGWAPVTNMYETVIWVALVTSVIGLVLELLSRRIYPALAASGVALLTTVLAANVSLLDPTIGSLQPVLRSNYWLTIHVLTIVSSYAAFALALGLGMLAVATYLTASYRRSPSFAELAAPLGPGLPLLAVGAAGVYGSYHGWLPAILGTGAGFYGVAALAAAGGMLAITALYGLVGELANRKPGTAAALGGLLLVAGGLAVAAGMAGVGPRVLARTATLYATWITALVGLSWTLLGLFGAQARATLRAAMDELGGRAEATDHDEEPELVGAGAGATASRSVGGGSTTARRPSVAEIRARVEAAGPAAPDARTLSMQVTAGRIKPLTNFIYRAMQVGVLLCAAGTILGGVWADYSWGRFWGWDPKEVWALITLLVYLVPLHGRFAGWVNTFGLVFASVVCFLAVLMAWYGVNFVLGVGLHSYGFVEGGGQGIVVASSLAVIAVACGAHWRRKLASTMPAATTA